MQPPPDRDVAQRRAVADVRVSYADLSEEGLRTKRQEGAGVELVKPR